MYIYIYACMIYFHTFMYYNYIIKYSNYIIYHVCRFRFNKRSIFMKVWSVTISIAQDVIIVLSCELHFPWEETTTSMGAVHPLKYSHIDVNTYICYIISLHKSMIKKFFIKTDMCDILKDILYMYLFIVIEFIFAFVSQI